MEWLVAEKIAAVISPQNQLLLSKIEVVPAIDSTNSHVLAHCKKYDKGFVLLAEEQTQGRGRQGKVWHSPQSGNIYASLLWHMPMQPSLTPVGLAVAVILVEALERLDVPPGLQLKWPNDIYFAGRKLAGILIESVPLNEKTYAVVIGIGLNVEDIQEKSISDKAISLTEIKNPVGSRNKIAGLLIDALLTGLARYHGFNDYLKTWQRYDMLQGKSVVVHTAMFSIPGIALGVNRQGELLVRDEFGKEHTFHSGEVSVMLA